MGKNAEPKDLGDLLKRYSNTLDESAGEHQLIKMSRTESKYNEVKLLKEGKIKTTTEKGWGYKHIFEEIRPGGKTRAQELRDIWPELKTDQDIINRMDDTISNGRKLSDGGYVYYYKDKDGFEHPFKVVFATKKNPESVNSIIPSLQGVD